MYLIFFVTTKRFEHVIPRLVGKHARPACAIMAARFKCTTRTPPPQMMTLPAAGTNVIQHKAGRHPSMVCIENDCAHSELLTLAGGLKKKSLGTLSML